MRYAPLLARDPEDEIDFEEAFCEGHPPKPPAAFRRAVSQMSLGEFAERVWQSSEDTNLREHISLFMAKGIPPEQYEEGTDLFTVWAFFNIPCGPDPRPYHDKYIAKIVDLVKALPPDPNDIVRAAFTKTAALLGSSLEDLSYTTDHGQTGHPKNGTLSGARVAPLTPQLEELLKADGWEFGYNGNSQHPDAACYFKKIPGVKTKWGDMMQLFRNGHLRLVESI